MLEAYLKNVIYWEGLSQCLSLHPLLMSIFISNLLAWSLFIKFANETKWKRILSLRAGLKLTVLSTILNIINCTNTGQGVIGCVSLLEMHLDCVAGYKLNMKQSWDAFAIKANIILEGVNEIVHKIHKVLLWLYLALLLAKISPWPLHLKITKRCNSKKDKEMIRSLTVFFSPHKSLWGFF